MNAAIRCSCGTAPRPRGRPPRRSSNSASLRNSPASAGTTATRSPRSSVAPEQPRVRGDDLRPLSSGTLGGGTAPRPRGRRPAGPPDRRPRGNSPASAGTTVLPVGAERPAKEQPRVRGDDDRRSAMTSAQWGTAPRPRGRPGPRLVWSVVVRNSPASAGTTLADLRRYLEVGDFTITSSARRRGRRSGTRWPAWSSQTCDPLDPVAADRWFTGKTRTSSGRRSVKISWHHRGC